MKKSNSIATNQPSSLRRNLQNLLIILIITFVLLEATARLLWWDQKTVSNLLGKEIALLPIPLLDREQAEILDRWARTPGKYVRFDPVLGWSVSPNVSTVQEGETYTANSAGMRSLREYALEKPAGVIRIGTFGPSFTHGDEVSDEATWQAQMEQARPELEVMNWGVGGYGTDQAFLRYQMQGAAYRPDIVIIGFEEDNLRRNVNRYRPFFRAGTGLPLTKPVFVVDENKLRLLDNPYTSLDDLRAALLTRPTDFLDKVCPGDYYCIRDRYQPRSPDVFYSFRFYRTLTYEIEQANQPVLPAHLDPYVQQVNFLLLERFVTEVLNNGARPVILLFPERASIEAHERGQKTAYTAGFITLTDHGLPVIDLAPAFVHARQTDQADYLDYYASDGGHFNARGNYIVSQTVLGYLCQHGLINNC